jgi:cell wall-associated NlpC family hydrolase
MEKVENWSIRKLRPGDILCVAVRSANPNHLAVYVGGGNLIHHPFGQISRVEPMRDFWRMGTCYVLRHPQVPDLTVQRPKISIMELADGRYDVKAQA